MKKMMIIVGLLLVLVGSNSAVKANYETPVAGISKSLDKEPKYYYTTDRVNFRKGASTTSEIIKTLDTQTEVKYFYIENGWARVKYEDNFGYISTEYLSDKKTEFNSDKNAWGVQLTKDEIDLLAKIVWLESRGEENRGQRAVIEIILNRLTDLKDYPCTLLGVLSETKQFTTWKNRNKAEPTEKEYDNIDYVLNSQKTILGREYVYFSTSPRKNDYIKIGNHYFCKK